MSITNKSKLKILRQKAQLLEETISCRFRTDLYSNYDYYEEVEFDYDKEFELFKNRNRYVNDIFNKVEFIGTVEQVKQINETLNRESIEIEKANYLDIQEFIKIPEELNIECKPIGLLIMYLLFGSENGVDIITADEARLRFEMYDRIEQEKGFDLALKYYDNIKKYGHVSKHSWIEKNCRIALNSINSFRIYKEESIKYSTDKDEIPYMIEELSKKFPDVQFNCLWDNITYQLKKSIANGKILKPDGDNDLSFDQPKIIDDIGSYYREVL